MLFRLMIDLNLLKLNWLSKHEFV